MEKNAAALEKLGSAVKMVVNMLTRDNTPVRIEAAGALLAAFGDLATASHPAPQAVAEGVPLHIKIREMTGYCTLYADPIRTGAWVDGWRAGVKQAAALVESAATERPAIPAQGQSELPPLPKAERELIELHQPANYTTHVCTSARYTADQMRAYARAAQEQAASCLTPDAEAIRSAAMGEDAVWNALAAALEVEHRGDVMPPCIKITRANIADAIRALSPSHPVKSAEPAGGAA